MWKDDLRESSRRMKMDKNGVKNLMNFNENNKKIAGMVLKWKESNKKI